LIQAKRVLKNKKNKLLFCNKAQSSCKLHDCIGIFKALLKIFESRRKFQRSFANETFSKGEQISGFVFKSFGTKF